MDNDTDSSEEPIMHDFQEAEEDLSQPSTFHYPDPFLSNPLNMAILRNDFAQVEKLASDEDTKHFLNSPDNNGNVPLHHAVMCNCHETIQLLLQKPHINQNHQNHLGNTPLLMSVKRRLIKEEIIISLLEAGGNVNLANSFDETPLHYVVEYHSAKIASRFIEKCSNINVQDANLCTPLHRAVENLNIETTILLVRSSANVHLPCLSSLTPLMLAINSSEEIAEALVSYYDDYSCRDAQGYSALLLAANNRFNIAIDLVRSGACIQDFTDDGHSVISFAIHYDSSQLFELVWPRFNYNTLLRTRVPFLLSYMVDCKFSISKWLECLYKILDLSIVYYLVHSVISYFRTHVVGSIFSLVALTLHERNVFLPDRLCIFEKILNLNVHANLREIEKVYELFGYNEELELFIQHGISRACEPYIFKFPVMAFILVQELNYYRGYIFRLFEDQFHLLEIAEEQMQDRVLRNLEFFAMPYYYKSRLLNFCTKESFYNKVVKMLAQIPVCPSLVELCRNKIRAHMKKNRAIATDPAQFHQVIKTLSLPLSLHNVILFKQPLYTQHDD